MNKKLFIFILLFFILTGIVIVMEQKHMPLKEEEGVVLEPIRAISVDIPEEIQKFTALDSRDDSNILKKMFKETSEYEPANDELQIYMQGQSIIEDNKVTITVEKQADKFLSGKLESKNAFRYGTFKFKVKTVRGKGLFPAIWLIPAEGEEFPELDIYELIGSEPDICYGVLHYYKNDMKKRNFFQHRFPGDSVPEVYEIMLEWTKDKLTWYVNGEEVHSIVENVPQIAMYLNINLAVGGIWPGNPDENTEFPTAFEVEIEQIHMDEVYER